MTVLLCFNRFHYLYSYHVKNNVINKNMWLASRIACFCIHSIPNFSRPCDAGRDEDALAISCVCVVICAGFVIVY